MPGEAAMAAFVLAALAIPWVVRAVDGRLLGDRLGRLSAAAVSALILGVLLASSILHDPALLPARAAQPRGAFAGIALLCLAYWILLSAAWLLAARLRRRGRSG